MQQKEAKWYKNSLLLLNIAMLLILVVTYSLKSEQNTTTVNKLNIDWVYTPRNSTNALKVKIGDNLFKLLKKNNFECCSGYYSGKINIQPQITNSSNIGLLLPATGGLNLIEINGRKTILSNSDHSSGGTIIALSAINTDLKNIDIKIFIESNSINFAGMWKGELILGRIQDLELARDSLNLYQKFIPLILAIVFIFLSFIFKWIADNPKITGIIYKEYFYGFIFCSLTLFFLSGIPRAYFPKTASILHYSINSMGLLSCLRILLTLAKFSERIKKLLCIFFIILILIQITLAQQQVISKIDELTLLSLAIIGIIPAIKIIINNKETKTIQAASLIYATLCLIDSIHIYYAKENIFFPLPYFVRFSMAIFLFSGFFYIAKNLFDEVLSAERIIIFNKIASQVSHDIKSPLAALEISLKSFESLTEEKRIIIKNSIQRIRDISNSLLIKNKTQKINSINKETQNYQEEITTILLSPLIDSIVTEKRIQYRNQFETKIDFKQTKESYGLFANIQPNEFQRMLSNLIDNSIEAFKNQKGSVEVILNTNLDHQIEMQVKDNGKGIPASILPKLGTRGETYGKEKGSGLGLFHAQETIQAIQGSLKIDSSENTGTTIRINIPLQSPALWFVPKINLKPNQTLIIFDDDQSIHQIWKNRIESLMNHTGITIRSFSEPAALKKFYGKNFSELDEALFLIDFDISGSKESGLDIIESLGIQTQSILVTSHFDEIHIREHCEKLAVHLIPKTMIGFVPMEII